MALLMKITAMIISGHSISASSGKSEITKSDLIINQVQCSSWYGSKVPVHGFLLVGYLLILSSTATASCELCVCVVHQTALVPCAYGRIV